VEVPNGYIALGWLLFLQEQIKDIIIIEPSCRFQEGSWRFQKGSRRFLALPGGSRESVLFIGTQFSNLYTDRFLEILGRLLSY
jgi:hypothetical protein